MKLLALAALVGLLASAAVLARRDGARALEVATLRIGEVVERARILALDARAAHVVVFDPGRERIGVVDRDGASVIDPVTRNALLVELSSKLGARVDLVEADFGVSGAALPFDGSGVPVGRGRVVLRCGDDVLELVLVPGGGALVPRDELAR